MGHADAVFDTAAFSQGWSDNPDSDPPPGQDFAAALVSALASEPECTVLCETVDADDWEHSSWFFWITFGDTEYTVYLECTPVPESIPGRWRLCLVRKHGLLKSLSGRAGPTDLPASTQHVIEGVLERVADARNVQWVSARDAESALCG